MDEASAGKEALVASEILVEGNLTVEHFDSHTKSWDDFSTQDCMCCCMGYKVAYFSFPHSLLTQIGQRNLYFHCFSSLVVVEKLGDS